MKKRESYILGRCNYNLLTVLTLKCTMYLKSYVFCEFDYFSEGLYTRKRKKKIANLIVSDVYE